MRSLPDSYEETILGAPAPLVLEGGKRQFRGPYGRHVYETRGSWVVHRDTADPRVDPVEHLLADAPEWGAGLLAFGLVGYASGKASHDRALVKGANPDQALGVGLIDGLLAGALAGCLAFGAVALIRALLRGD